jgi:O-antigen ligase
LPDVAHRSEVEPKGAVLISALLGVIIAETMPLGGGKYTVFLAAALLGGLVGVLVLLRPVLLLYFVIPFSAAVSVFREVAIPIGNTDLTLSGLLWLGVAFIIVLSLLIRSRHLRIPRYLWPFIAFLVWVVVRWTLTPTGFLGLKDVLWYSMPVLFGLFTSLALGNDMSMFRRRVQNIERVFLYSALIPVMILAIALGTGLAKMTWRGPKGDLVGSARGIPLFLLTGLAVALAKWRYGPNKWFGKIFSFVIAGTIFFTLARMASLLALGLIALSRTNPRRKWQILFATSFVGLIAFYAITHIPVLQQRFFFTEDWDPSQGLRGVNTAGRNIMWPYVFASAMQAPVAGHGLGMARLVTAQLFVEKKDVTEYLPHNEYLQIFHDMGLIGLLLALVAWGGVFVRQWQVWERAKDKVTSKWAMVGTFGAAIVLVSSITDNPLHYSMVIGPVAAVIGIAAALHQKAER